MSHQNQPAKCSRCGTPLDRWDHIHRKLWQRIFFPGRGRFKCSNCGKKHLVQQRKNHVHQK